MKLKTIAAAISMAAASQAFALGPTATINETLYVSGSSAQFSSLQVIADSLFVVGTIDNYTDTAGKLGANYRAYFGTVKPGFGLASGKNVLLIEKGNGGSYNGVGPLARGTTLPFMAVNSTNCTAASGSPVYPTPTFVCGATTVSAVPDVGVSDEEPTLFTGVNLAAGQVTLTPSELANITPDVQYDVVIGIAATNKLISDIATVPGLHGGFTKAQVAAILSGTYSDWSSICDETGVNCLPAGTIFVEGRAPGSGTRASANAYFLNNPCGVPVSGALTMKDQTASNPRFVQNSSSGTLQASLDADNALAGDHRAIGYLSLEYVPTGHSYGFVNINGEAPTNANAVAGAYDYYVTQSIQYRKTTVNGARFIGTAGANVWTDAALGFIKQANDPAVASTIPGVVFDPVATPPGTYSNLVGSGPLALYDVASGSRNSITCQALQLQF